MKTASALLADQLKSALAEACCDSCGTMSKKTGKKVCCADEKKHEEAKAGKVHYTTVADLKKAAETGEDLGSIISKRVQTEDCHFLYIFPDAEKAKNFVEEGKKKYGWRFEADGVVAGMITRAFADSVASKFGGEDIIRAGITDPKRPKKTEGIEPFLAKLLKVEAESHTHPFIKRCVAAMTGKDGSKDPHDPKALSSAFAICTASKKRHPDAAKEKAKEGVPAGRMKTYEKALSVARKARHAEK